MRRRTRWLPSPSTFDVSLEMISFRKLLDPRTPQKICVRTYELFLEGLAADRVAARLRAEGFTDRASSRAVTFLASAFARAHYEREGIEFKPYFYPGMAAYRKGRFLRYEDEPIFRAAVELAEQLRRDGDEAQIWCFIEISAEHRTIAYARARGLTPEASFSIYEF